MFSLTLEFVVNILQQNPDNLDDGEDERTNAREPVWYLCVYKMHQIYQLNRAWGPNDTLLTCILHTSSKAIPEGSAQRGTQRVCRHVIGFIRSPVVGCKRPCQSHLTQSSDKVCTPEEQEDVVELKDDQIFVIWRFPTIESKQALRLRTVCLHSRESEVLEESEKNDKQGSFTLGLYYIFTVKQMNV